MNESLVSAEPLGEGQQAFVSPSARDFLIYRGYRDWVERQQYLIPRALAQYRLQVNQVINKGLASVVLVCQNQQGQLLVAKFAPAAIIEDQARTLALLGGRAAPQLLGYDRRWDLLLLEYIDQPLSLDQVELEELADTLAQWQLRAPPGLPSALETNYQEIVDLSQAQLAPPYRRALDRAAEQLARLTSRDQLIHRDLHPDNIMRRSNGQLVIIDPHGGRGSTEYDIAYLYCRAFESSSFDQISGDIWRLSWLLGLDRDCLNRWLIVRAAISAAFYYYYWRRPALAERYLELVDLVEQRQKIN